MLNIAHRTNLQFPKPMFGIPDVLRHVWNTSNSWCISFYLRSDMRVEPGLSAQRNISMEPQEGCSNIIMGVYVHFYTYRNVWR